MRPEAQAIVDQCKDFVRAMGRVEAALGTIGTTLEKDERTEVVRTVMEWLGTDEVTGAYTREIARELISQLSAAGMYADYSASTDYIQ
ncbi:MAG TPA: hypothetical protein VGR51_09530 [Thermoplasmata archaeon]|nr:hypothetical protein [Thermoplasmata archaeon]